MIRKALIGAAVAGFCLTLAACDGGDSGGDPAKEARRPQPTQTQEAPGPKLEDAQKRTTDQSGG